MTCHHFSVGKFEKDKKCVTHNIGDWVGKEALSHAAGVANACSLSVCEGGQFWSRNQKS